MLKNLVSVCRSAGMLHSVLHKHKHWRQGGQLCCSFCSSARFASENDPLGAVKDNPYFDKYAEKIREKQKSSPAEFESRLKQAETAKQQAHDDAVAAAKELEEKVTANMSLTRTKKLNDVMKVDLIKEKTPEEIAQIWNEYHNKKDVIHAVISAEEYEEIHLRSQRFSTFIYPLPRESGYEFILQQWSGHDVHFTPLIAYQAHQDNAPACLNITHYTELMADKGLVLMSGEPDTKVISVYEAQLLALQVKLYYGLQSGLKFNYVRQFTNSPDTFSYMDLVKEFENVKKDSRAVKGNN